MIFHREETIKNALWHVVAVLVGGDLAKIYTFSDGKLENWVTFGGDFT